MTDPITTPAEVPEGASAAGDSRPIQVHRILTRRERFDEVMKRTRRLLAQVRGSGGRGLFRILLLTAIGLFVLLGFGLKYVYYSAPPGTEVSLDQLTHLGAASQVVTATFLDEDSLIVGNFCDSATNAGVCPTRPRQFWAHNLHSDALTPELSKVLLDQARVSVDPQPLKGVAKFGITFLLPIVILANLFGIIFLAKSSQGSIGDLVGFGSIGRRRARRMKISTGVTFADVAGADEAVAELKEVRDYLLDPRKYKSMGAQPPKGVLLFGPPGCGKTLMARAVAGESGVPFFSISGSEFVESLVGVGAARVRDLFRKAAQAAPAIIFIDELDAAGRKRGGGGTAGGSDEREQTLNQMLVAMDGFDVTAGIVVIGATNRPDILDPALLRPGRFDRHVTVDQPDVEGREAILKLHAKGKPVTADVDLHNISRRTAGFTGADLANVVNEAALLSIREGGATVTQEHFGEAIQRVLHGPKRKGRLISQEERTRVAYHESGHTLLAASLGRLNEFQRVSIVARGRGLGQSMVSQDGDRLMRLRGELEDDIVVALGGLTAEQVVFNEQSTMGESDLEQVTDIARQLAARYGMSDRFGPLRLLARDSGAFLGADPGPAPLVSQETLRELDGVVEAVVLAQRDRAAKILTKNRRLLDRVADRLIEVETLDGHELVKLLGAITPKPKEAIA